MTFDDGILTIYSVSNSAAPAKQPKYKLTEKAKYYFNVGELGVTRYYTALQANQQIENVVNVPDWNDITTQDICALENGIKYKITMVQRLKDDNNLKITRLSLERLGDIYGLSDN